MGYYYGNRNRLILGIVFVLFILFIALSVRSCTMLVHKPNKGKGEAKIFNGYDLKEEEKLLTYGASAGKHTDTSKYSVNEFLRLDNIRIDAYDRQEDVVFGLTENETEGILTYRGNAMRTGAVFGNASISKGEFSSTWKSKIDKNLSLSKKDWMGQPLVIKWSEEQRYLLKISEKKKNKSGLTEVICGTADGNIYFLDIEDGSYTRNPIKLSAPILGTMSVSSDKVPLLVVGIGEATEKQSCEIAVIDLMTNEVDYRFGGVDNFANDKLQKEGFLTSALITDNMKSMFIKNENGIIYSTNLKVNATTDGVEAMFFQTLEYTYSAKEDNGEKTFSTNSGSELAAWGKYIYTADENGYLSCINADDWGMVWMRKLGECVSATPVIEVSETDGTAYIYIGTSLSLENNKNSEEVYLYKLNAANGDIIWQREYSAKTTKKTDGGVVAAACVGENNLSDKVFFNIAGYDGRNKGLMVCINKTDGSEEYSVDFRYYSVTDPLAVYSSGGKGSIIVCDNKGDIFSIDGGSGKLNDTRSVGERITTNPVVFEDVLIVGTEEKIYGIKLD